MLGKIRGYFGEQAGENVSLLEAKEHTRLAVATVLLSAAVSDNNLVDSERTLLLKQLETRLGIAGTAASEIIAEAEKPGAKELIQKYLETLGKELSVAQREHILTLAWGIIAADRVVTEEETKFAVKLRMFLGLSIEQSIRARKAAEGLTIDGFKELVEASTDVHDGIKTQLARFHGGK